jgi:hypothetical protein
VSEWRNKMRLFAWALLNLTLFSGLVFAQNTFSVTGTAIPSGLLQQNYGKLPKGISGYDLDICNITNSKQSIVSSEIYQALAQSNAGLQPIGRQIMLAAILRSQNRSAGTVMAMVLNSVTGVLSILSSSKNGPPTGVVSGAALGAISAQQILMNLKPVLTNDQVEKFETEVLEPALVLDSGSCVERTVFAATDTPSARKRALTFRVR